MKIDMMTVTLDELLALEHMQIPENEKFNSIIIVPTPDQRHDSGFQCMKFVFLKYDGTIVGVSGGASDVLHIDGIGARLGVPKAAWVIDCLPNCGCLRLFAHSLLQAGWCDCSDAEVYATGIKGNGYEG